MSGRSRLEQQRQQRGNMLAVNIAAANDLVAQLADNELVVDPGAQRRDDIA